MTLKQFHKLGYKELCRVLDGPGNAPCPRCKKQARWWHCVYVNESYDNEIMFKSTWSCDHCKHGDSLKQQVK